MSFYLYNVYAEITSQALEDWTDPPFPSQPPSLPIYYPCVLRAFFFYIFYLLSRLVCFALKSWKKYILLFTYLITLGKDVTFPLITKFKTNKNLSYLSVNRIPNKNVASPINSWYNKPVLNLYFRFEFFIRKLDNSLCTSLIIRFKRILMIDTHKNVIRY